MTSNKYVKIKLKCNSRQCTYYIVVKNFSIAALTYMYIFIEDNNKLYSNVLRNENKPF